MNYDKLAELLDQEGSGLIPGADMQGKLYSDF